MPSQTFQPCRPTQMPTHYKFLDDTPRSGVVAATTTRWRPRCRQEKHQQISHRLAVAQRVGVGGWYQLTLTYRVSERSIAG